MNEEERKAVEILNTFELRRKTKNYKEISLEDSKSVETLLNLIEKLQKENEELKSNNEKYIIHLMDGQYKTVIEIAQNDINQKWIQKVKDKIEELKQQNIFTTIDFIKTTPQDIKNTVIQELQELLERRK